MKTKLLLGLVALCLSSAAIAGDPFDDARYYIGIKQNEQALELIDSKQFDVNMQTEEGFSLLHYAANADNLDMVKALLARGADPDLKANDGFTPYTMAYSTMVKAEIRKASAAKAADGVAAAPQPAIAPGPQVADAIPTAKGGTGTPNGMCDQARNDPASRSRSLAMRPFLAAKDAVWYNHPDELAGLLEDCVGADDVDDYGWTLLHHAADRDRIELARILLEHGATVGPLNKDRQTAAHLATSAEMKALLGSPPPVAAPTGDEKRKLECRQKYEADAALASDFAGKAAANRRWQKCLDTGLYW